MLIQHHMAHVLAASGLFLLTAAAQAVPPLPARFTATISPRTAAAGKSVTVTVRAQIDPRWHIYSVVPSGVGPVATGIASWPGGTPTGTTAENKPVKKKDKTFGTIVGYHERAATFTRRFTLMQALTAGKAAPVTLHYQLCSDRQCLPPSDIAVSVR